ncbi:hypothetical protein BKA70DRAFT_1417804 [Coprinopsis sp. MPI-PUGE-AT-0042]|nr:hypothetical protein BKA70DRAFT_1417804 [Coprinopsis sp. MPI-PUGE-AT-0042]
MPLYVADGSIDPLTLQTVPERYVIFYASEMGGKMWCPDCVNVKPLIDEVLSGPDSPCALVVFVGTREQWKTPDNIWRQAPWNVTGVPTVVKIKDGHPAERLVESQIQRDRFLEFVKGE